jgi:hypothetical protein
MPVRTTGTKCNDQLRHVCLSVCPHGRTRLSLKEFSGNLMLRAHQIWCFVLTKFDAVCSPNLMLCAHQIWWFVLTKFDAVCLQNLTLCAHQIWCSVLTKFDAVCSPNLMLCAHKIWCYVFTKFKSSANSTEIPGIWQRTFQYLPLFVCTTETVCVLCAVRVEGGEKV